MRYRIAENEWNLKTAPWRDAVGIEDLEDGHLRVPALVCWFTRGEGQEELARRVVDILNGKPEDEESDRKVGDGTMSS